MARVIQVSFDELSHELFDWVIKQNNKPLSWLGREALECLRLFGSLSAAKSTIKANQSLQVLIAWHTGEISREQAEEFIDADNLPELWRQAVEQGKELVR